MYVYLFIWLYNTSWNIQFQHHNDQIPIPQQINQTPHKEQQEQKQQQQQHQQLEEQHAQRQRQSLTDLFGNVRNKLTGGGSVSPLHASKSETFSKRKTKSQSPPKVCLS